jgi:pyrimidine operon attenuation protein/uracil phosphoribosyltransferase
MKQVELLMDAAAIDRALTRMTHQILEKTPDSKNLGIVGMQTRGVFLARRLVDKINAIEKSSLVAGVLDTTLYRDDYRISLKQPTVKITDIPFDITGINLVLVDDVLYTGRTVRAALDALTDFGRPHSIQLAVLIDRGHRQMPIAAEYVGREATTAENQEVRLRVRECDDEDSVWLVELEAGEKK